MKKQVLFLCTGNSCRSQMAEGWTRHLLSDQIEVASAGLEAQGLNPCAVEVMAEAGADISRQQSQCLADFRLEDFDLVVTVCDHAQQHCPAISGPARVIHHPFADPPLLAAQAATEEDARQAFREVRDQIRDWVSTLPTLLAQQPAQ